LSQLSFTTDQDEQWCCHVSDLDSSGGKEIELSAFVDCLCESSRSAVCYCQIHPVYLALKNDGIVHFHEDFVHMMAANIDALQHQKVGALVPLEMSYKMQLRALLAFYHHDLHKKRGGVNILKSTIQDFEVFRNSKCNPVQEIVPWGIDKR